MSSPLIVTAKMDNVSFDFFDELRRLHFPPERNFLAAHITLFHHLPGDNLRAVENDLSAAARQQKAFKVKFSSARFLGRGTAIEVESVSLISLRDKLAKEWQVWLTSQDRQKFKPHITIQNKVAPEEAKILFEEIKDKWQVRTGDITGLQLWHYRNGPWESAGEFLFG